MKTTPKDFFLYLGVLVTLYVGSGAFISLVFELINYCFQNELDLYQFISTGQQSAILVVTVPLLVIFSWLISRNQKKEIWVRKWFIYLTLFAAGLLIAGDLITLLYRFFEGLEITSTFLLKVLTVFVVGVAVFVYYILDIKEKRTKRFTQIFTSITILIILWMIVSGFVYIGTPFELREKRIDQEKVSDLQQIQFQVLDYFRNKEELPENLEQVHDPLTGVTIPEDPEGGEYEYIKVDETEFQLCATFNGEGGIEFRPGPKAISSLSDDWEHDSGKTCFVRKIDPEKHKIK